MGMFQNLKNKVVGAVTKVVKAGQALAVTAATGIASFLGLSQSGDASAAPVDLTALTTAVDFSTTQAAVLGVAAALILVYIAWKAAKMVISALRGM